MDEKTYILQKEVLAESARLAGGWEAPAEAWMAQKIGYATHQCVPAGWARLTVAELFDALPSKDFKSLPVGPSAALIDLLYPRQVEETGNITLGKPPTELGRQLMIEAYTRVKKLAEGVSDET